MCALASPVVLGMSGWPAQTDGLMELSEPLATGRSVRFLIGVSVLVKVGAVMLEPLLDGVDKTLDLSSPQDPVRDPCETSLRC